MSWRANYRVEGGVPGVCPAATEEEEGTKDSKEEVVSGVDWEDAAAIAILLLFKNYF